MRYWIFLASVAALILVGLTLWIGSPARINVRNESGTVVASVQINVVHSDTRGKLQAEPVAPNDQIHFLRDLAPGDERDQSYHDNSPYNFDILVQRADGRAERFYKTYIVDDWHGTVPPIHILTITPTGLLLDGAPPAPVESDPERDFGQLDHLP